MKGTLLAVARAIDRKRWDEARDLLRSIPLRRADRSERLTALALWQRILLSSEGGGLSGEDQSQISAALDDLGAAALNIANAWRTYEAIPILEARIGAVDASAVVATTVWDCVLQAQPWLFHEVYELFYRGGGGRCLPAWEQFLSQQRDYVPIYWHFGLLAKGVAATSHSDFAEVSARSLRSIRRDDLASLFGVYLKQMLQAPVFEIIAAARTLSAPDHRMRVIEYMTDMGYMPDDLPAIVAFVVEHAGDTDAGKACANLMQAQLANAEGRWPDVLRFADMARTVARYGRAADLMRAHALARMNEPERATALLDEIVADEDSAPFQRARATFIRVTTELVSRGLPPPEALHLKPFPALPGRPLAQSLWIGRKLRWIERLAIKSYLDNGWRFQLYVYDEPDNVPEGCEILDASAIIPARDVFREGWRSGAHAGSIGAFSDLFRYQLLNKRGGMWTDTDVINFRKFDPDGRRFICTEITDAGVVTLNGAMMAAPAGDELVARAYDRARALLSSGDMFFTRIGPYLLAELVVDMGVDTVELMPPGFLGPVSWMNTASLLQPYETVMAQRGFDQAINLHVYTEMWRTLGLGLDHPPGPGTFLGRLYADHFAEEETATREAVNA